MNCNAVVRAKECSRAGRALSQQALSEPLAPRYVPEIRSDGECSTEEATENARASLRQALGASRSCAFLNFGRGDRPDERAAKRLGGFEGQLSGCSRTRAEPLVHEIDGDRLLEQGVLRMVVRYHPVRQLEPSVLALTGALLGDDLNDRGTHPGPYLPKCFCRNAKTFCQPSSACSTRYIGRS